MNTSTSYKQMDFKVTNLLSEIILMSDIMLGSGGGGEFRIVS